MSPLNRDLMIAKEQALIFAKPSGTGPSALPRPVYFQVLRAALAVHEYAFARQAALAWLAVYPGDLQAGLIYAESLLGENHPRQALPILRGLFQADPEFTAAAQGLLQAEVLLADLPEALEVAPLINGQAWAGLRLAWANVVALRGRLTSLEIDLNNTPEARWSLLLRQARSALQGGEYDQAAGLIQQVLGMDAPTPLAGVTHLQVIAADRRMPSQAKLSLAEYYHRRWPDCLQCKLLFADWLMEAGEAGQAVALLHQAAARDVEGQAAGRLWRAGNPYRDLWPERLQLPLQAQVPASVVASLGWNQLPEGAVPMPVASSSVVEDNFAEGGSVLAIPLEAAARVAGGEADPLAASQPGSNTAPEAAPGDVAAPPTLSDIAALNAANGQGHMDTTEPVAGVPVETAPAGSSAKALFGGRESLRPIREELEKAAVRMKRPGLMVLDGRFPVYVIFSVRQGLERQYGPEGAGRVMAAMQELVKAVQKRAGWGARLFLADDPSCTTPLDIRPAKPGDPWELKLSLVDLDSALARRGQMIGAVLIVGGPEVVPFHCLPNPVDDDDLDVPSDNPYSTRDENYFVPEWPLGRLPGEAGRDPTLILNALRRIQEQHNQFARRQAWHERWLKRLAAMFSRNGGRPRRSLGYTAAIWKNASSSVYRPIGRPRRLLVSPPLGSKSASADTSNDEVRRNGSLDLPYSRLGYFNLHGLPDGAEWYGQSDPTQAKDEPDFPVALRPEDIGEPNGKKRNRAPLVVFSEACYGAHIQGKARGTAIALTLLAEGSHAVVGSTCMAYGSVTSPLIAADLLGRQFWDLVSQGVPAGEALQRAKIQLARQMHDRQGYLDGEDQKTLISFVLYGDPLARPVSPERLSKGIQRLVKPPAFIKTVCDRRDGGDGPPSAPPEVTASVKQVVARYLPGMAGAELSFSQERARCGGQGHTCPNGQLKSCGHPSQEPVRRLVVLSKQVKVADSMHTQYARLTLDLQGKLLKLAVSR